MSQQDKFYVVWEGWNTGIFTSWPDCHNSIQGYPAPKFKGFSNHPEAVLKFNQGPPDYYYFKQRKEQMAALKLRLTNPAVAPPLPATPPAIDSLPADQTALCIHVEIDQASGKVIYHYAWYQPKDDRYLPPFKLTFTLPGITVGWAEFDALIYGWKYLFTNGLKDCYLYTYSEPAYGYAKSIYHSQGVDRKGLDEQIIRGNALLMQHFQTKIAVLAKRPNLNTLKIWKGLQWGINPATKRARKVRIQEGSMSHIVNIIMGK